MQNMHQTTGNHTFVIQDKVFTSPNAETGPTKFPTQNWKTAELLLPRDLKVPLWAMAGYPQLGYCAWNTRWEGPLLERLRHSYNSSPIQKVGTEWSLSPTVAQSWISLESALLWVARYLLQSSTTANQLFPLDFNTFTVPSKFGYTRAHASEAKCRRCIIRSRDAFVPLMALCTMAIAIHSKEDEKNRETAGGDFCPRWVVALKEQKVNIDWIADLMASSVADLSPSSKRIGVLIRADGPDLWWHHIPTMVKAGVPVWIYWGTVDTPSTKLYKPSTFLLRLKPSIYDVQNALGLLNDALPELAYGETQRNLARAKTQPRRTSGSPSYLNATQLSVPPQTVVEPPTVERCSGQIQGETWRDMFARREIEDEKIAETETETARDARSKARARSLAFQTPGLGHDEADVFEWVEYMDARFHWQGHLVRRRVPKWQVSLTWDRYTNEERRFDDFRREWDLCKEFNEDSDDLAYDEPEIEEMELTEHVRVSPETVARPSMRSCEDVVRQAYTSGGKFTLVKSETTPTSMPQADTVASSGVASAMLAYLQFGFVTPQDKHEPRVQLMDQAKVEKMLGFSRFSLPGHLHPPLSDFLTGLLKKDHDKALDGLWDLLREVTMSPNGCTIRPVGIGYQEQVYMIEIKDDNKQDRIWKLYVKNPVSVLHILRLQGPHTSESLLKYMVTHGIACSTVWTMPKEANRLISHLPYSGGNRMPLMGWVQQGHIFDYANYRHYMYIRDSLLRRRYGRAALLTGGIVWRLARDVLDMDAALNGPSPDIYQYGSWHEYEGQGVGGDDVLSDDEENVICGLYKVYTATTGIQTEDASWWPKQITWQTGGLNVGYWSADCEDWFQKRLNAIKSQNAQPKNAATWKAALKYYKKDSRIVRDRLTEASIEYLCSNEQHVTKSHVKTEV